MLVLGNAVDRIGEMQRRAGLFLGRPKQGAEFQERCRVFGRAVIALRGEHLSLESVLGEQAERAFNDLCVWFGQEVGG